jgi:hypothetical protein
MNLLYKIRCAVDHGEFPCGNAPRSLRGEQLALNQRVLGSSPSAYTNKIKGLNKKASLKSSPGVTYGVTVWTTSLYSFATRPPRMGLPSHGQGSPPHGKTLRSRRTEGAERRDDGMR